MVAPVIQIETEIVAHGPSSSRSVSPTVLGVSRAEKFGRIGKNLLAPRNTSSQVQLCCEALSYSLISMQWDSGPSPHVPS